VFHQVDLDRLGLESELAQGNVRGLRARARGVVELHVRLLNAGYSQPPFGAENTQPLPACAHVAPSSNRDHPPRQRTEYGCEYQQDTADELGREGGVTEPGRQPEGAEELRG
jgi:hypothetical protein